MPLSISDVRGWLCPAMLLSNFQCRGVLPIWIVVGYVPTMPAVGSGGDCLDSFLSTVIYFFLPLS